MTDETSILLVEDDAIDVENVKRAFKRHRIHNPLYTVGNGEEALVFLRHEGGSSEPDARARPGIILLDINMPVMNGIELLRIIKDDESLKRIPVIVLTTSREENDRVASYDLGVAGYIVKPVDFNNFADAIRTIDLYWTLSELSNGG